MNIASYSGGLILTVFGLRLFQIDCALGRYPI
jgi:hypothetical protein